MGASPSESVEALREEIDSLRAEIARLRAGKADERHSESPLTSEHARAGSDDEFRQMADHSHEVFWTADAATGAVLYVNKAYETVWGRTCEALYNSRTLWREAIHPDDRQAAVELLQTVPQNAYSIEYRILRPDGTIRWIRDRGFPIRDADGRIARIAGIAEDITVRRETEQRLNYAVGAARCLLWQGTVVRNEAGDFDWSIHVENEESAQQFLPLEVNADINYTEAWRLSVLPEQWPELNQKSRSALLAAGTQYNNEFRCRNRFGHIRWLREDVGVESVGEDQFRLVGICTDITERKQAEIRSAAFSELGRRLSAAQTPREAGRIIVDVAQSLVGWDSCSFDLYSEDTGLYETVVLIDTVDGRPVDVAPIVPSDQPTSMALRVRLNGPELILRDAADMDPRATPLVPFGATGRRSACLIFTPACLGDRVVGVLSVQSYTPGAYTETDLATMNALADLCAGALERIQVAERLRESQARLQAVLDNTPALISVKDADGRYVVANRMYEQVFPCRAEEAIGKTDEQIFPARIAAQYRAHDAQVLAGWDALECEETVVIDNKPHTYLAAKFALRDEFGQARSICSISSDITERKQAEEALRESEMALRLALSAGQMNVWEWNVVEDVVTFADSRSIEAGSPRTSIGKFEDFMATVHPEDRSRIEQTLQEALVDGGTFRCEHRVTQTQAAPRWMSVCGRAFHDANVWPIRMLGISVDITERRSAEEALGRQAQELERSNNELEQFAYVASHDLQEPLRMVSNYTQLLARRYKGKLDADADDFIAFAVDGTVRMQTLIKDLLAYSRVASRGQEPTVVSTQGALDAALANLDFTLREAQATVRQSELPDVLADKMQLTQLFQNLVGNAIKFRSDRLPQIDILVERRSDFWEFRVQDNGIGIDPQYIERIFIIFQRLHTKEEYPGTGIGLAICKKIVERHGGKIWVEGKPGTGTTVCFTLPAASGDEITLPERITESTFSAR